MEYVEIKKVGKVVTGNTPSKKEKKYYDQNYIEFVKPSNFIYGKITNIKKGEEYLSYEGMKKGRIANKGDILVTCIGNIGNVGIVDKKVCFNQQINAIKCNKNYINNKYLANVIKYISPLLTHMANKAVVPILNKTQLENIKIPIFPKEIQEEIANILEVIQKNIDKRKEQLLLADELIKSRFIEMFGDESKFKKKKLNENVKEMFIGPFGSSLKNECFVSKEEGFCIVYEQKHAIRKTIDTLNRYVDKKKYEELKRFTVYPGDIIVSCRGTVGEIYRIPYNAKFGIMHPSIMKIRLNNEVYNVIFFEKMLEKHMKKILYMSQGSGIKMAITAKELGKKDFIVPPLSLQNEFAEFVTKTDKLKFEAEKSLKEMENLYDSLMQKFFKQ